MIKRILLFNLCFFMAYGVFAQQHRVVLPIKNATRIAKWEGEKFSRKKLFKTIDADNKNLVPPSQNILSRFGEDIDVKSAAINLFTMGQLSQNQVIYNQDLNRLVFVHRGDGKAAAGSAITYDLSTDQGATWQPNVKSLTPTFSGNGFSGVACRYPSVAIVNPKGNTDAAKATIAAGGPILSFNPRFSKTQANWGAAYLAASPVDGSGTPTEYYYANQDTSLWLISGHVATNDAVWNISTHLHPWLNDGKDYTPFYITKLPSDGKSKHQVVKEIAPDWTGLKDTLGISCNLAFSPDGQTGYACIMAQDANTEKGETIVPNIWKTTDGGTTWNKGAAINFSKLPELLEFTIPARENGKVTTTKLPFIFSSESDMVVDNKGNLNIIAHFGSRSNLHKDSTGFAFIVTSVFHLATDGTNWDAKIIDYWLNNWTPAKQAKIDGEEDADILWRISPQASRTADGAYVFMTYLESFTPNTDYTKVDLTKLEDYISEDGNQNPDIFAYAYQVKDGVQLSKWLTNPTEGFISNGGYYLATLSPIAIANGKEKTFELPIVYAVPGQDSKGALSSTLPAAFSYLKGAGFNANEFTTANEDIKIKDFAVYPNPTDGALYVDLNSIAGTSDIYLFDAIGRLVRSVKKQQGLVNINISNLADGIYFAKVSSDNGTATVKVILRK